MSREGEALELGPEKEVTVLGVNETKAEIGQGGV